MTVGVHAVHFVGWAEMRLVRTGTATAIQGM